MIETYGLGHITYLNAMWKHRHRFVPVYFKKYFFPFIHSTARSDGTNSLFKDNVGSTYSVISFLGEYARISQDIVEKEKERYSITRTTTAKYWVKSELEVQSAKMYNRQIFYRFQKQIMFTTKLHVNEIVKNVQYEVYKTKMLAHKEVWPRRFVVLVNLEDEQFNCICCKFEKDGMVCSHILRVLVQMNIPLLPEKYYIERWKPKERQYIRDKQFNMPNDLTAGNKHLRFHLLSKRLIELASDGSSSNEKYLYVMRETMKVEAGLDEMTKAEDLQRQKNTETEQVKATGPHSDGYGDYLENPDVAISKGRPQEAGRQKTLMETIFTTKQITCSHCGSHQHNIATCDKLHLPKSHFPSKKKSKPKQATVPGTTCLYT
jgi:hypothetical protein